MAPVTDASLSALAVDYGAAVLHVVWNVNRKTQERLLLCGAVELLPSEVPPPLDVPERCTELSRGHFLYTVDRVVSVSAALHWYELAKAGGGPPRPNGKGEIDPDAGLHFAAMEVDEEPDAPAFCVSDRGFPFAASWHCCSRSRHLIARTFRIEHLWTPDELSAACQWLAGEIHFDLSRTPEFWGSTHLIAPNPLFRSLLGRMDRTKTPHELIVQVDYRIGRESSPLHLELDGVGPMGRVFSIRKHLERAVERIPMPSDPGEYHERVLDPDRGLLYVLGPFTFLGSIHTTINLVSETRHVSVPLADGSAGDFSVPLAGDFRQSSIAGHSSPVGGAARRLRYESGARERRRLGRVGQRWFRDQVSDATQELRSLVGSATSRIWVADPYFSPDDVLRVLAAAKDPQVPIQILVGGEHLRSRSDGDELGDSLEATVNECQSKGRMNPLTIRVMPGAPPPLHDRLLLADADLWMLGSSLNAFGSRGTMLLKVPDPDPVLADLQRMWDDAEDFPAWLAKRRAARNSSTGQGDDDDA